MLCYCSTVGFSREGESLRYPCVDDDVWSQKGPRTSTRQLGPIFFDRTQRPLFPPWRQGREESRQRPTIGPAPDFPPLFLGWDGKKSKRETKQEASSIFDDGVRYGEENQAEEEALQNVPFTSSLPYGDASHPSRLLSFQELFPPMAFSFHSPQPPKGRASVRSRPVARQERKSKRSQSTTTCGYFRRICCEVRNLPCPPVATFSAIVLLPKRVKPWPPEGPPTSTAVTPLLLLLRRSPLLPSSSSLGPILSRCSKGEGGPPELS